MAKELVFKLKVINESGDLVEKEVKNMEDLNTAVTNLQKQLDKTDFGSKKHKELTEALKQSKGAMEEVKSSSKSLMDNLTSIPGPIGQVAQGFKGLGTAFKAIVANPIGLILTAIAGALTLIYTSLKSTKEGAEMLDRAMAGLNAVFDVFRDLIVEKIQPFLSKLFEDPIGAIKDFGKALLDNIINRFVGILELIPNLTKSIGLLFKGEFKEAGKVAFDSVAKIVTGVEDATDKIGEFVEEVSEATKTAVKNAQIAANALKVLQRVEDSQRRLNVERAKQNALLAEAKLKINDETLSYEERLEALDKVSEAEQKLLDREIELEQQRLKALKTNAALSDSDAATLDEIANSEIKIANLREQSFNKQKEVADQRRALYQQSIADEKARVTSIENIIKDYATREEDFAAKTEIEKIDLEEKRALEELERLKATEEEKQKVRDYYIKVRQEAQDRADEEAKKKREEDEKLRLEKEKEYNDLVIQAKQEFIGAVATLAGEESTIGKALLAFKQIMAFQETMLELKKITFKGKTAVAEAGVNAAQNVSESSKIGFPQNLITIAGAIVQGIAIVSAVRSAVQSLMGSKSTSGTGGTGGGGGTPSLGRNYEKGGLIGGRRHAQGGTLIEAELGEAVMTRGAVSMFGPMLSAMNQMGGGTRFNRELMSGLPDNPRTQQPSMDQSRGIIKAYVVESDLTSEQHKQARLKDLSTL